MNSFRIWRLAATRPYALQIVPVATGWWWVPHLARLGRPKQCSLLSCRKGTLASLAPDHRFTL
jgi:hypothetical protein